MIFQLTLTLAALAGIASAVVNLPMTRTSTPPPGRDPSPGSNPLLRTGALPSINLVNKGWWFSVELGFGTPAKRLPCFVDTGSGNTWVAIELWDPEDSSTFKNKSGVVTNCYGSGECITGYEIQDTVWVGDTAIPSNNLIVDVTSPDSERVLLGLDWVSTNDNLPYTFKDSGEIHKAAYSIWSNADAKGNGSICFGGIDQSKYTGKIGIAKVHDLPSHDSNGNVIESKQPGFFSTSLNGVYAKNSIDNNVQKVVTNSSVGILFDTGTATSSLPKDWLVALGAAWGCEWDDNYGAEMCGAPPNGSVIFDFSGVEVEIDVQNLVTGVWTHDGDHWDWGFLFGEQTGDLSKNLIGFGNSWQHYVYMVYDMDAQEIGFAKALTGEEADAAAANYDNPILEITDTVPGAYTGSNYGTGYHLDSTVSNATNPGTYTYSPTARH